MKRTPLKRYTPLKRTIPLKRNKPLNKMSNRAKQELKIWMGIKKERINQLIDKFGFVPCEHCMQPTTYNGSELNYPEAHHNDHNRRNNTFENCRILHRVCNQQIEIEHVKDVPSLL